jgi:hypothetical protein
MQAIVQLKTPLKCARGGEVKTFICNVGHYDHNNAEVIFPDGQRYLAAHSGILVADSIESSTWLMKEDDGSVMAGVFDISF